ncbi:MAG: ABC transporter ATP-binding protein [Xanthomonadales bacterium]|nr:ABC transporter ATP-binding protein [Xanthomonadales bacterium]
MPDILTLDQVSKQFDQTNVINQLSFSVREGEIFGLLGPNGAGKTTLVNIMTGLLNADQGVVTLFEKYAPGDNFARANIGCASQSLALYEDLTAEENLQFFGKMHALEKSALQTAVSETLAVVGLEDRATQRVKEFSGGMKRRLNLAVAILHKPKLLILDEPTVGVDPQSRNAIMESIQSLSDQGHTIIYTTHYMEEVEKLCDRVAIIDKGRLVALDSVNGLVQEYGKNHQIRYSQNNKVFTVDTDNPLQKIRELLDSEQQSAISNLSVQSPTLEQVFLNLTGHELRD